MTEHEDHLQNELNIALDTLTDRESAIQEHRCVKAPVGCGQDIPPNHFRDRESAVEYQQSGLCQKCQDEIFGIGWED